jgi:tetratricopeptide (TPR) repeat protein
MDATFDASLQRSLALRLASLYEKELADLGRAAEFLRKALALPGDEAPVLAALERSCGRRARTPSWPRSSRARPRSRRAGRAGRLPDRAGRGALAALEDADGALTAFRDAHRSQRGPRAARARAETLLDRPRRGRARWTCWSRWRRRAATSTSCSRCTNGGWSCTTTAPSAPTGCARWRRSPADQIGSPQKALDALGRALKEEPMPGAALDDLERIAGGAKLRRRARRKIEAAIGDADPDAARELALRAARLYNEGRDQTSAERLYQFVLEGDAENVDALQALEGLYRTAGRRAAAGGILEKRAEAELDPQARRARLMEAARAARAARRGGLGDAIAALQKLRAADDGDAEALAELARLHEAAGNVEEMAATLAERARVTEDPRRGPRCGRASASCGSGC